MPDSRRRRIDDGPQWRWCVCDHRRSRQRRRCRDCLSACGDDGASAEGDWSRWARRVGGEVAGGRGQVAGGRKTEDRRQKTEDRRQKTEDRRQKTEDRRQKTEDRRQKTETR